MRCASLACTTLVTSTALAGRNGPQDPNSSYSESKDQLVAGDALTEVPQDYTYHHPEAFDASAPYDDLFTIQNAFLDSEEYTERYLSPPLLSRDEPRMPQFPPDANPFGMRLNDVTVERAQKMARTCDAISHWAAVRRRNARSPRIGQLKAAHDSFDAVLQLLTRKVAISNPGDRNARTFMAIRDPVYEKSLPLWNSLKRLEGDKMREELRGNNFRMHLGARASKEMQDL